MHSEQKTRAALLAVESIHVLKPHSISVDPSLHVTGMCTIGGDVKWSSRCRDSVAGPQRINDRITRGPSHSASGCTLSGRETNLPLLFGCGPLHSHATATLACLMPRVAFLLHSLLPLTLPIPRVALLPHQAVLLSTSWLSSSSVRF